MRVYDLARASVEIGDTRSRKAKTQYLAAALRGDPAEVGLAASWLAGVLPGGKLGVGPSTLKDLRPPPAAQAELEVKAVQAEHGALRALSGPGSTAARKRKLHQLLAQCTELEQRFLIRLWIGELRQGALESLVLDAVAAAFDLDPALVRRAQMLAADLKQVAETAARDGAAGLKRFDLELFRPIQPMLAQPADTLDEVFAQGRGWIFERKLDGARVQIHREGADVRVFSRLLNDVTEAVPEIVEAVRGLNARSLVLDGEAIALEADGRPKPFQTTMRRFGRKTQQPELQRSLPLYLFAFDLLHLDGQSLIDHPLSHRVEALALVPPELQPPRLVPRTPTPPPASSKHPRRRRGDGEGVGQPLRGRRRGSHWLKLKQAHTVISWCSPPSGARAAARAGSATSTSFVMLGKTFKGLTDARLRPKLGTSYLDITDLDDWMTSSEFKNEACGGSGQGGGGSGQGNLSDVPLNPGGQGSGGSGPAEPAENEPPAGLAEMMDAMGSEQEEATIDLCTEPSVSLARALRAGMANSCFNTSLISARGTDQLLSEVDNMRQCKDDYAALGQSDCSLCIGWAGWAVVLGGIALAYTIYSEYREGTGVFSDTETQGAEVPEPVPADAPDAPPVDDNEKTAGQLFQEGEQLNKEGDRLQHQADNLRADGNTLVQEAKEARDAGDDLTADIKEKQAGEKFAQAVEKERQANEKFEAAAEKNEKAVQKQNGTQMGPDGVPDSIACNAMTDELYHPVEFDPQDQSIYEREDGPLPHMGDGFMELSECAAQSATPLFTSQSNCESFILCSSGTDCNCGLGLEAMGRDYTNFMNDAFVCSTTRCGDGSYPQRDGLMCRCDAPPGGGAPPGGAPGVEGGHTPLTPAFMKLIDTGFGNGATMRNSICHDSLAGVDAVEVIDAVRNDGDSIAGAAAVLEADFLATGTCSP